MDEADKGCPMIRMSVSGWMFLLIPAYPGSPGPKVVKRLCVCVCVRVCMCVQEHYVQVWQKSVKITQISKYFWIFPLISVLYVSKQENGNQLLNELTFQS